MEVYWFPQEELGVAVDRLCLEAVDQILKILETSMTRQEEAPPTTAGICGGLMKTQTGGGESAGQTFSDVKSAYHRFNI